MEVVVEQRPGIAVRFRLLQHQAETLQEILTILVIEKNGAAVDAPDDDMLEQAGYVNAGATWHVVSLVANVKISRSSP
jgi:hypothetical protein